MDDRLMDWTLDPLLAVALVASAWLALYRSDPTRVVLLFIAFGFLMSLVWVRLGAPDLALAEAAVGTGVTGALLIGLLSRLKREGDDPEADPAPAASDTPRPARSRWLASGAVLLALLALLPGALHRGLMEATLLRPLVEARLGESGVESAVTAVLLNFRALDTLLEVTVLAAAAVGVLALAPPEPPPRSAPRYSLLPLWLIPRLAPLIGLAVVYLWWAGSSRPGGAFQAGAALTGVLLLLYFIDRTGRRLHRPATGLRLALAGPLLFLGVALLPLAGGALFLDFPAGWAKPLILTVEAGLTASIGGALALLATGGGEVR